MRRIVAVALAAAALTGCGEDSDDPQPPAVASDPGVVHVHGLGRNPADGSLMIATHTGLFRVTSDGGSPERVGDSYQDTMGFTVIGSDRFLGSGHPASIQDDPPYLGLIESRDGGGSWKPISLRGDVDFHVLESQEETVYGFGSDFESRTARFLRSDDGGRSWTRLAPPEPLAGLAIDPDDPRHIVALGEERGYVSLDRGARWRPVSVPGGLVTWTRELGVVAVDSKGVVRSADDPAGDWREVGNIGGTTAALEAVGDELIVATHESRILSSRDGGETWKDIVAR